MILYLAGVFEIYNKLLTEESNKTPFKPTFFSKILPNGKIAILESYYKLPQTVPKYLKHIDFMLDSGAFTVLNDTKGKSYNTDWDEYIVNYANFIKHNNIDLFFELDIDFLVGYNKVLKYRDKIEEITNKPCIPVFHRTRGLAEFKNMCQKYKYIGISINNYAYKTTDLIKLVSLAHSYGTKVHGLGYTKVNLIQKIKFDSVDSTTYIFGNKYGITYRFEKRKIQYYHKQKGLIIKNRDALLDFNFKEWVKYQNYLRRT